MVALLSVVGGVLALASSSLAATVSERASDPCAAIAGKAYSDPALALACLRSFPVNETIKENVLEVVGGALDFFTFEAEQIHAPYPFQESSVNLRSELARIKKTKYAVSCIACKSLLADCGELISTGTRPTTISTGICTMSFGL